MPSPLGRVPARVEGQTDTPIIHHHLGEVITTIKKTLTFLSQCFLITLISSRSYIVTVSKATFMASAV
jgi:hypothetical protein